MERKECAEALYEWAEKDIKNRCVLCVTAEKTRETEDGFVLNSSVTACGVTGTMVTALVDAMKENKGLAQVIRHAFIAFTVENENPACIGVAIVNNGKEGKDE